MPENIVKGGCIPPWEMDSVEFRAQVRELMRTDGYEFETDEELLQLLKDKLRKLEETKGEK